MGLVRAPEERFEDLPEYPHDAEYVDVGGPDMAYVDEGGEFETLVTDGPHMDRPIRLEYETEWEGSRGHLRIEDAWLA